MTARAACVAASTLILTLGIADCGQNGTSDDQRAPAPPAFREVPTGWTDLPAPPEVRSRAATAWTGEKLLVSGGYVFTGLGEEREEDDGFVFDARAQEWDEPAVSPLARRAFPPQPGRARSS